MTERRFIIAVDAMSGDHGVSVCVPAACDVLSHAADLDIVLVGQPELIDAHLPRSYPRDRIRIHAASQIVAMEERPQDALRRKKDSSMRVAIDLVRESAAHATVSAGNTGALMATARFVLKTIEGIDRPAILSRIPAAHGFTHMLDLGANAQCSPEHLYQFAMMGSVVAEGVFGVSKPRVGLLNIGEEDTKGNEVVQDAAPLLQRSGLNYIGFVEGDDIFSGEVDVVVTDGFTGNVALKTMEGLARMIASRIRAEYTRNVFRKLSAVVSAPALSSLRSGLDPRSHNGASMVGLRGVVVKSHGSADRVAFANAIRVALDEARSEVPRRIATLLESQARLQAASGAEQPAATIAGS